MDKSVFVCTPAFGGQVSVEYAQSMLPTTMYFQQNQIQFGWYFIYNESLINRARNRCVAEFLKSSASHLLFIDADLGWTAKDMDLILKSDKLITGGTYRMKQEPVSLNLNVLPDDVNYFPQGIKGLEAFNKFKAEKADPMGLIEVKHVPTGYMLIDRKVFEELAPKFESYSHYDLKAMTKTKHKNFFPIRVVESMIYDLDGVTELGMNAVLESEDWGFCSVARENGVKIYLQSNIICPHVGTFTYKV